MAEPGETRGELRPNPHGVADAWRIYREVALPGVTDPALLELLHRAYYGGMSSFAIALLAAPDVATLVQSVEREVAEYFAAIAAAQRAADEAAPS
jgi:hypothetical protein